jgi:MazG family protein
MSERTGSTFPELVDVMTALLGPEGCPWDREQSLESLRPYLIEECFELVLIEECFELVDAMDRDDVDNHREELGDLLFQVVFQSALRAQDGHFDVDAVIGGIRDKLVHRHPHVFADASASDSEEVLSRWEEIKEAEKRAKGVDQTHLLDSVPRAMPSLSRAHKISTKVARVGFDWETAADCLAKVREETREIEEVMAGEDEERIAEEIGDLLFATAALARKLNVDSDAALRAANRKFEARFGLLEDRLRERGKTPKESNLEEMDAIWNQVKQKSEG